MTNEQAADIAKQKADVAEGERRIGCLRSDLASIRSQRAALDEAERVCIRMYDKECAGVAAGKTRLLFLVGNADPAEVVQLEPWRKVRGDRPVALPCLDCGGKTGHLAGCDPLAIEATT